MGRKMVIMMKIDIMKRVKEMIGRGTSSIEKTVKEIKGARMRSTGTILKDMADARMVVKQMKVIKRGDSMMPSMGMNVLRETIQVTGLMRSVLGMRVMLLICI